MPLFCLPVGSAKAKKSSASKVSDAITNIHVNQHQNNDNVDATSSHPYLLRYATVEFHAKVTDELTVMQDELVLFEYEDSTGDWSHVRSIRTSKSGYVPSKILTVLRQVPAARRKKMPRNEARLESSRHSHHNNRHHHVNGPAVSSSNGDNNRLSDHQLSCGHQHLSNVPHSFQGSAGNHTFSKFHDIGMVDSPATYYNLRSPNHCEVRFTREDFGILVVLRHFVPRQENDLEVSVGDIVRVMNKDDEDWYWVRRECDNEEGFVPAKFIKDLLSENFFTKGNSTISMKSSNLNAVPTYSNQIETLMPDQQMTSIIPSIIRELRD